jgi:SAM-dependent methyltransferase
MHNEMIIVQRWIESVKAFSPGLRRALLLDVGCGGNEKFPRDLTSVRLSVPGADVNVDIRIPIFPTTNFILASILALPFCPLVFDATLCSHVLEHLSSSDKARSAILELHRVSLSTLVLVPHFLVIGGVKSQDHHLMYVHGFYPLNSLWKYLSAIIGWIVDHCYYVKWLFTRMRWREKQFIINAKPSIMKPRRKGGV